MFESRCIKNKALFHIYRSSGRKLDQILEGLMDQFPLLLLVLLVSVTEDKFLTKLTDPSRVKDIAKLFVSGLTKESQQANEDMIKEIISSAITHLDLMNQIFPSDVLEIKIDVVNQLYLNTKTDFTNWLLERIKSVEEINITVRPNNIDSFLECLAICNSSYHGNENLWQFTTKWFGDVIQQRSKKILG